MEPGVIQDGLVVREEELQTVLGYERWEAMRRKLEQEYGLKFCVVCRKRWYATTHIRKAMERMILDDTEGTGDKE